MVNFKEIYHFSGFQRGSNIFEEGGGGSNFFQGGGVQLLIPYRTCDFPGGSGPPAPPPPLDSHLIWVVLLFKLNPVVCFLRLLHIVKYISDCFFY